MAAFQGGLPVRLIATPREALQTCRSDERLADVVEQNHEKFNYLPVTDTPKDGRARIIGLVYLAPYLPPYLLGEVAHGVVGDHMLPLSEDNLIGADAGILTFLKDLRPVVDALIADSHGCRLVMSGSQISGLVILSDPQKLPVRAALFALITHVEMTMADAIRREFNDLEGWKTRLSERQRRGLMRKRKAAEANDNLVDDLLLTQFIDKVTIILESPNLTESKSRLNEAQMLRNNLAHAKDYAATRDSAAKVCDTVRKSKAGSNTLAIGPRSKRWQGIDHGDHKSGACRQGDGPPTGGPRPVRGARSAIGGESGNRAHGRGAPLRRRSDAWFEAHCAVGRGRPHETDVGDVERRLRPHARPGGTISGAGVA
jgi:hypothetical protein